MTAQEYGPYEVLGRDLADRRAELAPDLTDEELAARMGTSRLVLRLVERHPDLCTLRELQSYAHAIGCRLGVGVDPR